MEDDASESTTALNDAPDAHAPRLPPPSFARTEKRKLLFRVRFGWALRLRGLPDGTVFQPLALMFCWSSYPTTPRPVSVAAAQLALTGTVLLSSEPVSSLTTGGDPTGGVVSARTFSTTLDASDRGRAG